MIDKIFDYLEIKELVKMTRVSQLFCFAATLERNFDKFTQKSVKKISDSHYDNVIAQMVSSYNSSLNTNKSIFSTDSMAQKTNPFNNK